MATPYAFLPQRAVLSLTGPDTIVLLERLVTHGTADWADGETRFGALLTPQGKVISDYLALRTADGVLLDVAKDSLPDLRKRLTLFRLRADVAIEPREDLFVIAGMDAAEHGVRPISGACHVYLDPRYPGGRLRALATEADWNAWYGYHPAEWSRPLPDYHADRIEAGIAEWGADYGAAEVFPADINMDRLNGVDLGKGCFVGQEVVSRMHRRGNIRKRTLCVEGEGLATGTSLTAEASLGDITSVEGGFGLARVRIDRLAKAGTDCLKVGGRVVKVHLPEWLKTEMQAILTHG
ncbi:MAG: folate-binding protein [Pseudomonadota bacterium]